MLNVQTACLLHPQYLSFILCSSRNNLIPGKHLLGMTRSTVARQEAERAKRDRAGAFIVIPADGNM